MHFKYTLGGSKVVEGDSAEIMFNKIVNNRLLTGNLWATWCDADDLGAIKIALQNISVLFEITNVARSPFQRFIAEATSVKESMTRGVDSRRIYSEMLNDSSIDIPYPEGCKLCNVATGCDGGCC